MSLGSLLFSKWWEDLDRPHYLTDQHFGQSVDDEDILDIIDSPRRNLLVYRPRNKKLMNRFHPFLQYALKNRKNTKPVGIDKDSFRATLDVQQFSPDEIKVKVVDKQIIVEAKHEEKEDEHGWVAREFVRKYVLPQEYDVDKLESSLSSDGVLTITAPKKPMLTQEGTERNIKIQLTGQPAITNLENSGYGKDKNEQASESSQSAPNSYNGTNNHDNTPRKSQQEQKVHHEQGGRRRRA
ncbi:protein lethal(2)essential for life-like [Prorops nasuta]|uniref:protein lethal(2)essential for life-like n=1 Tax=Prorops nasuta TaxID=863751 RepID=UPI0034D00E21